ncbi:MAG: hypothetical protein N2504_03840 [candidate division WOR-3 bacterium]|nr:hypothetical protein [candidate division WOR-3 bacterium]
MLYSLSLFPNRVGNEDRVAYTVVFFAKRDKKDIRHNSFIFI